MDYRSIFEKDFCIQKIKYRGNQGMGLCPFHDDRNPSLGWCIDNGLWTCHAGCGSGNTYQFAERLNMPNKHDYIDDADTYSKNTLTPPYTPINTVKQEDKPVLEVDEREQMKQLMIRYTKQANSMLNQLNGKVAKWKLDYIGIDDDGRMVFFYPDAIKHHKNKDGKPPWWEGHKDKNGRVIGSHCQVFMEGELHSFDHSKPLIIYEGEKDALIGTPHGISFSGGCGAIPDDLSKILVFPTIIIAYDNDESGRKGALKLAEKIKSESPSTKVKIANWNQSLPDGYDVYSDYLETKLEEFDKALVNAKEFTRPAEQTKSRGYKVMNANEIIDTYREPPKSIVEHIMVEGGVSLISGTDGVGKTWLGLQMAICIASGRDFLGFKVNQRPVLMIQFELSPEQLSNRLRNYDLNGTEDNLEFVVLSDEDLIFTDAWRKIEKTIDERSFVDGVVFIDNLYTSTNADVSKNQDLKPLLLKIDSLKRLTGNAFGLIGHHNKQDGDKEPILTKNIITGGKTLTNYVSNVFQLGSSSMGADVRRAKVTKTRDSYTDLENLPVRLEWNPEECLFHRKGIISNEVLHTMPIKKQWEIKVLLEMSDYMNEEDAFDRNRLMSFINPMFPTETPDTNYKKGSRWLNKMIGLGLITGRNNLYKLNRDEIRYLESDKEENK